METSYNKQQEPEYKQRSYNWKTAIGLQKVDGLVPTEYLVDLANRNIKGEIDLAQVRAKLQNYYTAKPAKTDEESKQKEADLVSQRIAEILSEGAFSLSSVELLAIHKHLFESIYEFAGKIRDFNISKKEWVLDGDSIEYGNYASLEEMLEHDIEKEKNFSYSALTDKTERVAHFAKFISDLWQIHPFAEGNTRTIAVFAIKYLRTFGYEVANEPFESNSWYFRNALVRANYNNAQKNIFADSKPLLKFFGNLLLGGNNDLKNRQLHINYKD
jgi:fido (protein-threonine AMPylation protein)